MPEGFKDLPVAYQVFATIAAVVFGGGIAFHGFTKKWLDKLGPASKATAQTDAVVISASFADGKPIKDLIVAIEKLTVSVQELYECTHDTGRATKRQSDLIEDQIEVLRKLYHRLPAE